MMKGFYCYIILTASVTFPSSIPSDRLSSLLSITPDDVLWIVLHSGIPGLA